MIWSLVVAAPLFGTLCLARSERGICLVDLGMADEAWMTRLRSSGRGGSQAVEDGHDDPLLREAASQIQSYLAGERQTLDLPIDLRAGSAFQRRVWEATATIPFGQVRSYGEVARQVGVPGGARAVGGALGKNPVPIIVPCHRVLRANGQLGGFGLGIETKRELLALEGIHLAKA
jgi:O-6-methylguanine DNA methyltransferase